MQHLCGLSDKETPRDIHCSTLACCRSLAILTLVGPVMEKTLKILLPKPWHKTYRDHVTVGTSLLGWRRLWIREAGIVEDLLGYMRVWNGNRLMQYMMCAGVCRILENQPVLVDFHSATMHDRNILPDILFVPTIQFWATLHGVSRPWHPMASAFLVSTMACACNLGL